MSGSSWWRRLAIAGAVFTLVSATPAVARAALDPGPVSPDKFFVGLVNGAGGQSRIAVVCDGPIDVVPSGHPAPGQTIVAEQVRTDTSPAVVGFTGSAARALDVFVGTGRTPVTLRFFHASAPIPTTILVPCSGTGTVTFSPSPDSRTARPATVVVRFVTTS